MTNPPHFIDEFVREHHKDITNDLYLTWTGLFCVSAALDRKAWTHILKGRPIFPNIYVLLVGEAAIGKGEALTPAYDLLQTQLHVNIMADNVTQQKFVEKLGEFASNTVADGTTPFLHYASAALCSQEWGTFLPRPDQSTMAMLATVFDSGSYTAETIKRGEDKAENLYFSFASACVPAWFAEGFPPNAYEQGLPTRIIYVFAEGNPIEQMQDFDFIGDDDLKLSEAPTRRLRPQLDRISKVRGNMGWTTEAGRAFNDWKDTGLAPAPVDPMLRGYCGRRIIHTAKVSTLFACAAHPGERLITLEDFDRAKALLLETEKDMPRALAAAGGNTFQLREQACYGYVAARFKASGGKAVPEWEVRQRLGKTVPPHLLAIILDGMVNKKMINVASGNSPLRMLKPGVVR